jgi:hypothetical protein
VSKSRYVSTNLLRETVVKAIESLASTYVGTVSYAEAVYEELPVDSTYVNGLTQEKLVIDMVERWREGKVSWLWSHLDG